MTRWSLMLVAVLALPLQAGIDAYDFETPQQEAQFQSLIDELRCPKCQNQNIADSNAPISMDMRREVHRMVLEGASDDDIVQFMVERFGDFVTYRPRFDRSTLLLWLGPGVVALLGIVIVTFIARRHRPQAAARAQLDPGQRRQLQQWLADANSPDSKDKHD